MEINRSFSAYETRGGEYETLHAPLIKKEGRRAREPRRLLIDNNDRVTGNVFDFQVRFGNGYRANSVGVSEYFNVRSAEMKLLAFPKVSNTDYVIVSVDELRDYSNLDASNDAANGAFAVGFFDTSTLAPGDTKPIRDFYSQRVTFNPPLPKLDRLTVRFLLANGDTVNTGLTGGQGNASMLLEIVTE